MGTYISTNGTRASFVSKQRATLIGAVVVVCVVGGYVMYRQTTQPKSAPRSILGVVEKGTISSTVSGSGQISLSNQIDVKPKVSGDIILLGMKKGDDIKEGAIIAKIDSRDAQKGVRDARDGLASARLSLEKLKAPADRLALLQVQHSLAAAKEAKSQAEKDLETAHLNLDKLKSPVDALALTQAQNAVTSAKEAQDKASTNLTKAYDDGFGIVVSAFLDMPTLLSGLDDMFFQSSIDKNQLNTDWYANQVNRWNHDDTAIYQQRLSNSYDTARAQYAVALATYKASSRTSDHPALDTLISQTADAASDIDTSIKAGKDFLEYVQGQLQWHSSAIPSILTTNKNSLDMSIGKITTLVTNVSSAKRSIGDAVSSIADADRTANEKTQSLAKLIAGADPLDVRAQEITIQQREQAIVDAQRSIDEKTQSLAKLIAGADPLDIQSQELAVQQRDNALRDAQEKLLDYTITAPFDGVVAQSDVKKGDTISPGTVLATVITKQRIAQITLNEVDVSKIAMRQKAVLTVDALPDVSITGEIADIDTLGTVSQGVVSYTVKITFDTQDERVKPGMSVSANIITAVHPDTLMVPNTAVKSQGAIHYVEVPSSDDPLAHSVASSGVVLTKPTSRKQVEIGISNDESTEITSGLNEGESIVINSIATQSTTSTQNRTQQQTPSLRIPGLPGGGGGFRGGGG